MFSYYITAHNKFKKNTTFKLRYVLSGQKYFLPYVTCKIES